jgi:hypothetical protein
MAVEGHQKGEENNKPNEISQATPAAYWSCFSLTCALRWSHNDLSLTCWLCEDGATSA